jgi:hypothetical protein
VPTGEFLVEQLNMDAAEPPAGESARSDCNCEPVEIPDNETLIRAIYYWVHVGKDRKLKWQAYEPTINTDEISIMRSGCLSPTDCKIKSKEMQKTPMKLYKGFAALSTGAVRSKHFTVSDSREYFCGHGHISIGEVNSASASGEPSDPKYKEKIKDIAKELIRLSTYYEDPAPDIEGWPNDVALLPPFNN